MTRGSRTLAWTLLAAALFLLAGCQSIKERFEAPEPELIYSGAAPGLADGVLVIDDAESLEPALAPLDPDYAGEPLQVPDFTVLRVVGRERSNPCRQTKLTRVSTARRTATVYLEERVPAAGCECPGDPLPAQAWLVKVSGWVTRAEREITDVVVPCDEVQAGGSGSRVVQLLESSWQEPPGAEILTAEGAYREVLDKLGVGERGPEVDFEEHRVVAVTGRPRENGCRSTKLIGARLESPSEAVFTLQEIYPGPNQACPMVFQPARVFLYQVPASVDRARVVTEEQR